MCAKVIKLNRWPKQSAKAWMWFVAAELAERNYDRVVQIADNLQDRIDRQEHPEQALTIQLLAAEAARRSKQYERAIELNDRVIEQYQELSAGQQGIPAVETLLPRAHVQKFRTLKSNPETGSSPGSVMD